MREGEKKGGGVGRGLWVEEGEKSRQTEREKGKGILNSWRSERPRVAPRKPAFSV